MFGNRFFDFWPFLTVFSPRDLKHRPPDTFFHRFGPIFIQIRWLKPYLWPFFDLKNWDWDIHFCRYPFGSHGIPLRNIWKKSMDLRIKLNHFFSSWMMMLMMNIWMKSRDLRNIWMKSMDLEDDDDDDDDDMWIKSALRTRPLHSKGGSMICNENLCCFMKSHCVSIEQIMISWMSHDLFI